MMSVQSVLLRGVSGVFEGEQYVLGLGACLVVGRSRSCDVSAARTRSYRRIGGHVLNRSRGFLKMSRRHFQVSFEDRKTIRIRDLSTNGVKVDGERAREVVYSSAELMRRKVLLTFGDGEGFLVSCTTGPLESHDSLLQGSSPSSSGLRL